MGWSGGSSLFGAIIEASVKHIKDDKMRKKFYLAILPEFDQHDWDTQRECEGKDPVFDKVLRQCYPEIFEEEDDE